MGFSYMEKLLRDGGDLDSMDRSLLDYNGKHRIIVNNSNSLVAAAAMQQQQQPQQQQQLSPQAVSSPVSSPQPPVNGNGGSGILSPAAVISPTSFMSDSGEFISSASVANQILKRDMVVRFTEGQANCVQSSTVSAQAVAAQQQQLQNHSQQRLPAGNGAEQQASPTRSVDLVDGEGCGKNEETAFYLPARTICNHSSSICVWSTLDSVIDEFYGSQAAKCSVRKTFG